jgi:hypothetical protein
LLAWTDFVAAMRLFRRGAARLRSEPTCAEEHDADRKHPQRSDSCSLANEHHRFN